jgi:hypothetical protein
MPVALLIDPSTGKVGLHGWDGTQWLPLKVAADGSLVISYPSGAPSPHASSHQDGGSDEINVQGLSGELATEQKSNFLKLTDTPSSYAGYASYLVRVKSTADGLEFTEAPPVGLKRCGEQTATQNQQTLECTGLDISSYAFFWIIFCVKNASAAESYYYLLINGDTTLTNYYVQYLTVNTSTLSAARVNDPRILILATGLCGQTSGVMTLDPTGNARAVLDGNRSVGSGIDMYKAAWAKTAVVANVTRVTIQASQTTGIGTGSRLLVFGRA